MKPASCSFLISSRIKLCRSMDCFRLFYWTGLALEMIFKWCFITSLGILGICDGCQANTFTLAQRKVMSVSSYLLSRLLVMRVVWTASTLI
jgi:hypothetical protein